MTADTADEWLAPWLQQLRSAAGALPMLELGCDTGRDTIWLVKHGFEVVATDVSAKALKTCAALTPAARCVLHDLREPMPFADESFGAVVASLCLHYFDWKTTVAAVAEIRRCISPAGLFLCRVNSERDYLHGAGEGEEIEPGYYRQRARYAASKRFFSCADLDRLFLNGDWRQLARSEVTIHRYEQTKVAWEIALSAV